MNARPDATGDGSTDPSSGVTAPLDPWERALQQLERLQKEHASAHQARVAQLNAESERYLATLEEEKRQIEAARERQRSSETQNGEAASDAAGLRRFTA